jgi:hypothetical protein
VSAALSYPVLLIGQGSLDVRDSEEQLISITGASSLNLMERVILDSSGRLFSVVRATPEKGSTPLWRDMGTSPRRFAVTVSEQRKPSWMAVQELLLEQVKAPNSTWKGDPRAVAKVRSLRTVEEAIAASRESWSWMR